MIVEDEPITAADLQQKVAALGHAVVASVDTGEEAVAKATALAPDLVLMDIRLQGRMSGVEAAEQLQHGPGSVPIVFLTAFADQETVDRACRTKPFGYLLKPFTERGVATAVQVALTRAHTEQAQLERERWMSAALRGAGEALVAVDKEGTLRFLNEHAETLLGVKEHDVLGTDVKALMRFDAGADGDAKHPVDRALRDGQIAASPRRTLRSAGIAAPLDVAYSAAPVRGTDGELTGAVIVLRGTAVQEPAPRLELTEALSSLSMRLSHEINNPLTYNLGALRLALRELDQLRALSALGSSDGAAMRQREDALVRMDALLRGAHEGANRVAGVMRELHSFPRSQAEDTPLHPVELLDLALGMSGEGVGRQRILRRVSAAPMLRGDKWQLARVLAFALQHAAETFDHAAAGTLLLEIGVDERGWAALRVAARREPGNTPARTSGGGHEGERRTSVTMAMAQHAAASCGGELRVREDAEGRTVELLFPPLSIAADSAKAEPKVAREPAPTAKRGSVLVVDDEPLVGRVLKMTLRREHDVTAVTSAVSALSLLERGDAFDVILCDLMMPEMDGQELYRQLSITRPDLAARTIIMSGGATNERAARFLDSMAGRRLDKPFETDELLRMIRQRMVERGGSVAQAQ